MHPLDNPFWHALTGPQITWAEPQAARAEGRGKARRYAPDVAPFAGLADASPQAWRDLQELAAPGEGFALFGPQPLSVPADFAAVSVFEVAQLVLGTFSPAPQVELVALGPADAPQMRDLARLTRPGPFRPRTVELGGYVGVREGDLLLAMAGERARPPGFAEVSAVCVHPQARGRGLAAGLVSQVVKQILARGETPFLHVDPTNTAALSLYTRLGFTPRATLHGVVLRREG